MMKCPKCGNEMQIKNIKTSETNSEPTYAKYGVCYDCKVKQKITEQPEKASTKVPAAKSKAPATSPPVKASKEKDTVIASPSKEENASNVSKAPFSTPRLIIGIISLALCGLITVQSMGAGLSNILSLNNELSGSAGFILSVCMLIAGIITICLHKKTTKSAFIVPAFFYLIGSVLAAANIGSYADLKIWAVLSGLAGCVHLLFLFLILKINVIVAVLIPILLLSGIVFLTTIGAPKSKAPKENSNTTDESAPEVAATKVAQINLDIEDGALLYTKHELTKDYDGNPAVKVYFNFTNKSDSPKSAQNVFHSQIFQNGVECNYAVPLVEELDNEAYANSSKELQKDTTLEVAFFFSLQDETSPLTLKVAEFFNLEESIYQEQELVLQ